LEINQIALLGYSAGMLGYGTTCLLFLSRWQGGPYSRQLALASGASAVWACVLALKSWNYLDTGAIVVAAEWMIGMVWIASLVLILRNVDSQRRAEIIAKRYGLTAIALLLPLLTLYINKSVDSIAESLIVGGGIAIAILLVSLVEQIYRNLPSDGTSSLKYLCVALPIVSLYNLVFFIRIVTGGVVDQEMWAARGYISALVIAPLVIIGARSEREALAEMPRQVVLYSFSLVAVGTSVVLWLAGDFFLTHYGGSWGNVIEIVVATTVLCALGFLLVSSSSRARTRVFLTKYFFKYKYDYRKEWLRFISTLSASGLDNVAATAVRAVAQIVDSPGGIVCIREEERSAYVPIGSWRCDIPTFPPIKSESGLIRFLAERQWVIDLHEISQYPARYDGLQIDTSLETGDEWWLIVPLYLGKSLYGFVCLKKPRIARSLNFEDHDLLRTVGRHVATHINQAESDKRLAEASQFGTYNRMTAFLMHDLNNLIAQQSLVVSNAEKYRDNPKFVDDAINTIANSVSRMKRLMQQLTRESTPPKKSRMNLCDALLKAVERSSALQPVPELHVCSKSIIVLADHERLTTIFEHLIRNAQDATPDDGEIKIEVKTSASLVTVSIVDTGKGMNPEFVRERLFRPFDSTKGSHAMGIGAYQAREYTRMLGGQLDVESLPGKGTRFILQLPTITQ
jgi:putative PEP-CTERM system histidine kinase